MTAETTDEFRMDRRGAALVAILSLALVALALIAAAAGPGLGITRYDLFMLVLCCLVLGGVAAFAGWCWHRPPVVFRVGPRGIEMPLVWRGPVPWRDIHRIQRITSRHVLASSDFLRIDLSPGQLPPYRLKTIVSAEKVFLRRVGLRLPIGKLDAPADRIVASLERFRPVVQREA